jgi:hypothetical protein
MKNLAKKYGDLGVRLGKEKHVILSARVRDWPRERYEKTNGQEFLEMVYAVLHQYSKDGVYAGSVFPHPWRFKHHDGTECHDPRCDREHVWIWGPHAHFVGYGYFADSRFILKRTGVFLKVIQDKKDDRRQKRDIVGTLAYELSHVGLWVDGEGEQIGPAYTWVGLMAFCKGGGDVLEKTREPEICEKCGAPVMEYAIKKDSAGDSPRVQDLGGRTCAEISALVEWQFELGQSMRVVETIEWYVVPRSPARLYALLNRNRRRWINYWLAKKDGKWAFKKKRARAHEDLGTWLEVFDYRAEDLELGTSDWLRIRDSQADLEGHKTIVVPPDPPPRISRELEDLEDCLIFEDSDDSGILVRDPLGRKWVISAVRRSAENPVEDLEGAP